MKWWNDIWLNEGFATWMSWKPLEAWKPEWNAGQQEIGETQAALVSDSVPSVRTIRANAETPAEIQALFDGIAYGKAASVLRMVEAYVGPEEFQKGVNAYVDKHAYANATAEDFWNQIAKTSGKPVDNIMKSFTEQAGAPLVTVSNTCKGGKTEVTLKQERYVADAAKMAAGSNEIWPIPVKLLPSATKKPDYYLLAKKEETITLPGCSAWVYANAGGKGYYRSSYDPAAFAKMSVEVENAFSPEERVGIPSDAWALVRVGRMSIGDYLELLEKMQGERTREVVQAMVNRLSPIHDRIAEPEDRAAFEKWVRDFLRPMAKDLGATPVAGEPAERQALRADVFEALAQAGRDPELVEQARSVVEKYMSSPDSVNAELASKALLVAARNGDAALYGKYVQHLKTAKTPEEYYNYLLTLGEFPQPDLAKKTFDLMLSDQVKNQDMFALVFVLRNYETQTAAWELFKSDFPAILDKVDPSTAVGLAQVSGVFCDAKLRDDSQKFFAEQKLPGTERILQNGKEQVNACIGLREAQEKNLSAYLGNTEAKKQGSKEVRSKEAGNRTSSRR
jgi:aminopeptidase N/puromycin-sensitive aminopeptidase